jgi:hypothetical protein
MMRHLGLLVLLMICYGLGPLHAQRQPDQIFMPQIRTVKLHPFGNPLGYPIIPLNGRETLELHFDDMDADVKMYYYTFELCNADWSPVQMSYFDYVKGFTRDRINTYRNSSLSLTRYTHYQATIPNRNIMPTKSGNYLLKVFLNGDTAQLAFTRRFLVVERKFDVAAQVTQPYNQQYFLTHHRLDVTVNTTGFDVRYPNQQLNVVVLQNYRWDNRLNLRTPSFIRQGIVQYNNENDMVMPGGKEWRWANLRSFRLLGDRVQGQRNTDSSFRLYMQDDHPRLANQYFYFNDQNGFFANETTENINPYWNADYALVRFRFLPPGGQPFRNRDVYIIGELTGYGQADSARMRFNAKEGVYETNLYLKQGYYDYQYATRAPNDPGGAFSTDLTEQQAWETENSYLVLVYYRDLGGRFDQLVGMVRMNSQFRRN